MSSYSVFSPESLRQFAQALLEKSGVERAYAALVADSLIAANLRGVDTHGMQLLQPYMERMAQGDINHRATGRVVSENGGTLVFDGQAGLGQVVATTCCGHAVRLARAGGLGLVVARESSHFGACAYWARRISREGLIGIVMCNSSASIAPWQGREARLGTNPICMSVPCAQGGGWLLDMATTTVARGKIMKALLAGEQEIPAGWAMDLDGRPTTSTAVAMQGLPTPLGGYKGSGLAVMVEILCAVLSGGALLGEVGGIWVAGRPLRVSQMFLAVDVARFMPLEAFERRIERLVRELKSSQPAAGYEEVLVAGDPEWRNEAERLTAGVPIEAGVWKQLVELAERFGVDLPVAGGC